MGKFATCGTPGWEVTEREIWTVTRVCRRRGQANRRIFARIAWINLVDGDGEGGRLPRRMGVPMRVPHLLWKVSTKGGCPFDHRACSSFPIGEGIIERGRRGPRCARLGPTPT